MYNVHVVTWYYVYGGCRCERRRNLVSVLNYQTSSFCMYILLCLNVSVVCLCVVVVLLLDMLIPAGGVTLQVDLYGRETGVAYVEFIKPEDAEKALCKDLQMIGRRYY